MSYLDNGSDNRLDSDAAGWTKAKAGAPMPAQCYPLQIAWSCSMATSMAARRGRSSSFPFGSNLKRHFGANFVIFFKRKDVFFTVCVQKVFTASILI